MRVSGCICRPRRAVCCFKAVANSADYIEYLIENLGPLGFVSAKRMFGGHGIYCDDRMFGLVASDVLFLKVDDTSRAVFEAECLEPFRFDKADGSVAVMSYYECPGAALDDQEVLLEWAQLGIEAALRAPAKKKKPAAKKKQ